VQCRGRGVEVVVVEAVVVVVVASVWGWWWKCGLNTIVEKLLRERLFGMVCFPYIGRNKIYKTLYY